MTSAPRLACAAVAAICGAAAMLSLGAPQDGAALVDRLPAILSFAVASALAGAWLLPRFVAPRRRSWLRAALGGLLTAPLALVIALAIDIVRHALTSAAALENAVFWLLLGAAYAAAAGAPFFIAGALALHAVYRRRR